jgi:hypothetical protein
MNRRIWKSGVANDGGNKFDKPISMFTAGDGTALTSVLDASFAALLFLLVRPDPPEVLDGIAEFCFHVQQGEFPIELLWVLTDHGR